MNFRDIEAELLLEMVVVEQARDMANVLKQAVEAGADRLSPDRPGETLGTLAIRKHCASMMLFHGQLNDGSFIAMTLSLLEVALLLDVGYHLARQMRRACRDDGTLGPRLAGLMDKLFRACEQCPARPKRVRTRRRKALH